MFRIELLPALHGDCIWIEYGDSRKPSRILIDGGPQNAWKDLQSRLGSTSEFELLVLTHIDADHIAGAIPFLKEADNVSFGDVWFNGWPQLRQAGHPTAPKPAGRKPRDTLGAKQGEMISTLLVDRRDPHPWNARFGGGPVQATEAEPLPQVKLPGGMKLTILSPTPKQLARLRTVWRTEIARHNLVPGAHHQYRQFLARQPVKSTDVHHLANTPFHSDGSVPNAASIAFLAEYEGKAVLFTGDAVPSVLVNSITRLLAKRKKDRLRLDALKVPHHGSRGNTSMQLLSLLDCRTFLISCNGDIHKLPDNEAIGRIIQAAGPKPELIFNYACKRTEDWGDAKRHRDNPPFTTKYGDKGHIAVDLGRTTRRRAKA